MADADTQLGIDRGRHIFIVHPDQRRTAGEPLYLLKGAHPGGVESNKAHEIALLVGFQAVSQEAILVYDHMVLIPILFCCRLYRSRSNYRPTGRFDCP